MIVVTEKGYVRIRKGTDEIRLTNDELAELIQAFVPRAEDEWMETEAVAEATMHSDSCVRGWLRSGELPGRKIGRKWSVKRSDVEAMMEARGWSRRYCARSAARDGWTSG